MSNRRNNNRNNNGRAAHQANANSVVGNVITRVAKAEFEQKFVQTRAALSRAALRAPATAPAVTPDEVLQRTKVALGVRNFSQVEGIRNPTACDAYRVLQEMYNDAHMAAAALLGSYARRTNLSMVTLRDVELVILQALRLDGNPTDFKAAGLGDFRHLPAVCSHFPDATRLPEAAETEAASGGDGGDDGEVLVGWRSWTASTLLAEISDFLRWHKRNPDRSINSGKSTKGQFFSYLKSMKVNKFNVARFGDVEDCTRIGSWAHCIKHAFDAERMLDSLTLDLAIEEIKITDLLVSKHLLRVYNETVRRICRDPFPFLAIGNERQTEFLIVALIFFLLFGDNAEFKKLEKESNAEYMHFMRARASFLQEQPLSITSLLTFYEVETGTGDWIRLVESDHDQDEWMESLATIFFDFERMKVEAQNEQLNLVRDFYTSTSFVKRIAQKKICENKEEEKGKDNDVADAERAAEDEFAATQKAALACSRVDADDVADVLLTYIADFTESESKGESATENEFSSGVARLISLEQRLLQRFDVQHFSDLHCGFASFLAFIEARDEINEALLPVIGSVVNEEGNGSSVAATDSVVKVKETVAHVHRADLRLPLMAQTLAANEREADAARAKLISFFDSLQSSRWSDDDDAFDKWFNHARQQRRSHNANAISKQFAFCGRQKTNEARDDFVASAMNGEHSIELAFNRLPQIPSLGRDIAEDFIAKALEAPPLLDLNEAMHFDERWSNRLPRECTDAMVTLLVIANYHAHVFEKYARLCIVFDSPTRCVRVPFFEVDQLPRRVESAVLDRDALDTAALIVYTYAFAIHSVSDVCASFSKAMLEAMAKDGDDDLCCTYTLQSLMYCPSRFRDELGYDALLTPTMDAIAGAERVLRDNCFAIRGAPEQLSYYANRYGKHSQWSEMKASMLRKRGRTTANGAKKEHGIANATNGVVDNSTNNSSTSHDSTKAGSSRILDLSYSDGQNENSDESLIKLSDGEFANGKELIEELHKEFENFDQLNPSQRKSVLSSFKHLSEDLYAEKRHFLYELLQNCDDNKYENGVTPTVRFEVMDGSADGNGEKPSVRMFCNEIGFQEKDVRAICSMAQSSKEKSTKLIGKKGIGFKAVYAITDEPAIHSGAYHFSFDKENIIRPTWIEQCTHTGNDLQCSVYSSCGRQWNTTLHLPLSERSQQAKALRDLRAHFEREIDAKDILFLQQLRKLEIYVEQTKTTVLLHRDSDDKMKADGAGLVKLRSSSCVDGDLPCERVEVVFVQSRTVRNEPVGPETNVCVAFLVDSKEGTRPLQNAYAFLPIKCAGLHFMTQADFKLSTARDGIVEDDERNRVLRGELSAVFVDAFRALKGNEKGSSVSEMTATLQSTRFFAILADPAKVSDSFLKPFARSVLRSLSEEPCIPILSKDGNERKWMKPSEVISCAHLMPTDVECLRELLARAEAIFGAESIAATHLVIADDAYLDRLGMSADVRQLLRLESLGPLQIAKLVECVLVSWREESRTRENCRKEEWQWICDALAQGCRMADVNNISYKNFVNQCRPLLLFPVQREKSVRNENNQFADTGSPSLHLLSFDDAEGHLLASMEEQQLAKKKHANLPDIDHCFSFHIICNDFLRHSGTNNYAVLKKFMKELGVQELNEKNLLSSVVEPLLIGADGGEELSEKDVLLLLLWVFKCDLAFTNEDIRKQVRLAASNGSLASAESLRLAHDLTEFQGAFPDFVQSSSHYLFVDVEKYRKIEQTMNLRDFISFLRTRLSVLPSIPCTKVAKSTYKSQSDSPWRCLDPWRNSEDHGAIIECESDWASEELNALIENVSEQKSESASVVLYNEIVHCLSIWPDKVKQVKVKSPKAIPSGDVPSSLLCTLLSWPWIAASINGDPRNDSKQTLFVRPQNAFINDKDLYEFSLCDVSSFPTLSRAYPNAIAVYQFFRFVRMKEIEMGNKVPLVRLICGVWSPCFETICLDANLMRKVYREILQSKPALDYARQCRMPIFVPIDGLKQPRAKNRARGGANHGSVKSGFIGIHQGMFRAAEETCWKDPASDITSKLNLMHLLKPYYTFPQSEKIIDQEEFERLFHERMQVPSVPIWTKHAKSLQILASSTASDLEAKYPNAGICSSRDIVAAQKSILTMLNGAFCREVIDEVGIQNWQMQFKANALLPCDLLYTTNCKSLQYTDYRHLKSPLVFVACDDASRTLLKQLRGALEEEVIKQTEDVDIAQTSGDDNDEKSKESNSLSTRDDVAFAFLCKSLQKESLDPRFLTELVACRDISKHVNVFVTPENSMFNLGFLSDFMEACVLKALTVMFQAIQSDDDNYESNRNAIFDFCTEQFGGEVAVVFTTKLAAVFEIDPCDANGASRDKVYIEETKGRALYLEKNDDDGTVIHVSQEYIKPSKDCDRVAIAHEHFFKELCALFPNHLVPDKLEAETKLWWMECKNADDFTVELDKVKGSFAAAVSDRLAICFKKTKLLRGEPAQDVISKLSANVGEDSAPDAEDEEDAGNWSRAERVEGISDADEVLHSEEDEAWMSKEARALPPASSASSNTGEGNYSVSDGGNVMRIELSNGEHSPLSATHRVASSDSRNHSTHSHLPTSTSILSNATMTDTATTSNYHRDVSQPSAATSVPEADATAVTTTSAGTTLQAIHARSGPTANLLIANDASQSDDYPRYSSHNIDEAGGVLPFDLAIPASMESSQSNAHFGAANSIDLSFLSAGPNFEATEKIDVSDDSIAKRAHIVELISSLQSTYTLAQLANVSFVVDKSKLLDDVDLLDNSACNDSGARTKLALFAEQQVAESISRFNVYGDCNVIWMNERKESYLPYDILVFPKDANMEDLSNALAIIEVKSTTSPSIEVDHIEISANELSCAQQMQDAYEIFRFEFDNTSRTFSIRRYAKIWQNICNGFIQLKAALPVKGN